MITRLLKLKSLGGEVMFQKCLERLAEKTRELDTKDSGKVLREVAMDADFTFKKMLPRKD